MSVIQFEATGHVARKGLVAILALLALVALVFIDQTLHWLINNVIPDEVLPSQLSTGPHLWFLLSLFYFSASLFGFALIRPPSVRSGKVCQGLSLVLTWSLAASSLFSVLTLWEQPGSAPLLSGGEVTPVNILLFVLDQCARGAFFDLFEVMDWTIADLEADPTCYWLSATLVIFRAMTSIASVLIMVRLLGLRSSDPGVR